MTETDPLLTAVEALTKPVIEHIAQKTDGKWVRTHTVEHDPLLRQLADAVNPSKNSGPGTPATPATRSLLNFEAVFLLSKISSEVRSWCRMAGAPVTRPPHVDVVEDLIAWFRSGRADGWFAGRLVRWADQIRETLDPPERVDARIQCPVCGATSWGDVINGGGPWAVRLSYRKSDDGEGVSDERALCRACSTVWRGREAVDELRDEVRESAA